MAPRRYRPDADPARTMPGPAPWAWLETLLRGLAGMAQRTLSLNLSDLRAH